MLTEVQIVILAVVIGVIAAYVTYRIVLYYLKEHERSKTLLQETRKSAFAISGNLVQEFPSKFPITTNYRLTKILLGRGSSAEVFVGENILNSHRYAIKVIDLTKKDVIWRYEREKNFLKDIEHSNVIRLFEVYNTSKKMFFVMELCTGGHLGHLIRKQTDGFLPELKAREYILQITRAIMHCHDHGICHRDIKLQNILLENNSTDAQIKIVDFGNAVRFLGCTPLKKVVGTTYTAAPEVFRQSYDERCDIWSLGVVAYILLSGRRPFERVEIDQSPLPSPAKSRAVQPLNNLNSSSIAPLTPANIQQILPPMYQHSVEGSVIASILLGRYHFHHEPFKAVNREAIYFIKTCMEQDYTERAYAKDLLSHPWLRNDFLIQKSLAEQGNNSSPRNMLNGSYEMSMNDIAMTRRLFSFPMISPLGAKTLLDSTTRHLANPVKTGMRDTSMLAIAFSMPVIKIKQIRTLFQEIDRNGNGLIEKEEFRAAMLQIQSELSTKDIDTLFDSIDQNGDGSISFLEFVAAMIDPREVDIKQMNQAFKLMDKDRKGYLTREDLVRLLCTESSEGFDLRKLPIEYQTNPKLFFENQKQKQHASGGTYAIGRGTLNEIEKEWQKELQRHKAIEDRIDRLFKIADLNGDGKLTYTEFLFAMAEGSVRFEDLISSTSAPTTPAKGNTSTAVVPSSAPPSLKGSVSAKSAHSSSDAPDIRRQSEGNVNFKGSAFRLRSATIRNRPAENTVHKSSATSSVWSLLSISAINLKSTSRVKPTKPDDNPETLYVLHPDELKGGDLDPVDYLEDSPVMQERDESLRQIRASSSKGNNVAGDVESQTGDTRKKPSPAPSPNKKGSSRIPPMLSKEQRSFTSPALLSSNVSSTKGRTNDHSSDEEDGNNEHYMSKLNQPPSSRKKLEQENNQNENSMNQFPENELANAVHSQEDHRPEEHPHHNLFLNMKIDTEEDDGKDIMENRDQLDDFLQSTATLPTDMELGALPSLKGDGSASTQLKPQSSLKSEEGFNHNHNNSIFRFYPQNPPPPQYQHPPLTTLHIDPSSNNTIFDLPYSSRSAPNTSRRELIQEKGADSKEEAQGKEYQMV